MSNHETTPLGIYVIYILMERRVQKSVYSFVWLHCASRREDNFKKEDDLKVLIFPLKVCDMR